MSGGTATYEGLSFRTLDKDRPVSRKVFLRDGEMVAAYLNPSRAAYQGGIYNL